MKWYQNTLTICNVIENRYQLKGFYVLEPNGLKLCDKISNLIEKEFENENIHKYQFPKIIQNLNSKKKEKIEKYLIEFENESYFINKIGMLDVKETLNLKTNNDISVFEYLNLQIKSYKELPFKMYQNSTLFRHEIKSNIPLIRSREFNCLEIHFACENQKSSLNHIERLFKVYEKILNEELGLYGLRLRKFEYQSYPNSIFSEKYYYMFPNRKSISLFSLNYLGNESYSDIFNLKFQTKEKTNEFVHLVSSIFSIQRVLASLISNLGDDFGLIVPPKLSKFDIVIIPIYQKNDKSSLDVCKKLEETLKMFRIFIDDSEDKSPGEKFYHWERQGIPLRIEIGPKDIKNSNICIVRRDNKEKKIIKLNENIEKELKSILQSIENNILNQHQVEVKICNSFQEIIETIEKGIFAKVAYSTPNNSERFRKDENLIIDKTNGEILGYDNFNFPNENDICFFNEKKSNIYIFISKTFQ
eukprot:gene12206-5793_t